MILAIYGHEVHLFALCDTTLTDDRYAAFKLLLISGIDRRGEALDQYKLLPFLRLYHVIRISSTPESTYFVVQQWSQPQT